jgi:hypothetical protein
MLASTKCPFCGFPSVAATASRADKHEDSDDESIQRTSETDDVVSLKALLKS